MTRYILRRLLSGLVTLWGISLITFAVIQFTPGDPAQIQVAGIQDRRVSAEMYEQLREYYGLDRPLIVQYWNWLTRLVGMERVYSVRLLATPTEPTDALIAEVKKFYPDLPDAEIHVLLERLPLTLGSRADRVWAEEAKARLELAGARASTSTRFRLVLFDLGRSFHDGLPVATKIGNAFWPTVTVAGISIFVAFLISVPIGIYSAARQNGPFDKIVSTTLYMLYSIPSYVMGMILILVLGVWLELLPFRGMRSDSFHLLSPLGQLWDYARHYVMITFCFTFGSLAYYSRFVRQNLLEVIRQDYIRTARAKGLGETKVVLKHAFVNSLIPFITLLGLTFPAILSGSVILETMFNWPGIGRLYFESVLQRDYPTLMALNFITAAMVLGGTLLADLAYGLVDPRVSYD